MEAPQLGALVMYMQGKSDNRRFLTARICKLENDLFRLRQSFSAWGGADHYRIERDIDITKGALTVVRSQLRALGSK